MRGLASAAVLGVGIVVVWPLFSGGGGGGGGNASAALGVGPGTLRLSGGGGGVGGIIWVGPGAFGGVTGLDRERGLGGVGGALVGRIIGLRLGFTLGEGGTKVLAMLGVRPLGIGTGGGTCITGMFARLGGGPGGSFGATAFMGGGPDGSGTIARLGGGPGGSGGPLIEPPCFARATRLNWSATVSFGPLFGGP